MKILALFVVWLVAAFLVWAVVHVGTRDDPEEWDPWVEPYEDDGMFV